MATPWVITGSGNVFPGGKPEAVYRLVPDRVEAAVAQVGRFAAVIEPSETVQVVRANPADDRRRRGA